jgi:hypothetical protein
MPPLDLTGFARWKVLSDLECKIVDHTDFAENHALAVLQTGSVVDHTDCAVVHTDFAVDHPDVVGSQQIFHDWSHC